MTKAQMTRVAVNGYGVIANESIVSTNAALGIETSLM